MAIIAPLRTKHFWKHYIEMVVAMFAGMFLLTPVTDLLFGKQSAVVPATLLMATTMTIGMTAWMAFRKHSWRSIAEMAAAMYVPFVVLYPFYWAGWMSGGTVMMIGHVIMLPAMAAVMLRH
ncbi:flagellar biosynthetic protein FliP [Actinokineospora alba]|uniref:Flagellar biosynthetic protein FliP n=1 Tax=Actinokineospora alba TaxID=504798 RepID=A0A1H0WIE9_9PSEU|nr:hypothetical protein [Actinokineospora alba]TDP65370.1 flagellar biosynthetic protein FliP [Actinokineospora alba]SDH60605.1 flagellar biosynthetic protein FliP [Actinokineospora alba]SDP90539.1 flagellar biosynthetic protein FliP [Actinokineospora alba]